MNNPNPDRHNIKAYTKFRENPLIFKLSSGNENTDGRVTDGRVTDTRTVNGKR